MLGPCYDIGAAWQLRKGTFLGGREGEKKLAVEGIDSCCEAELGNVFSTEMESLGGRIVSQGVVNGMDGRDGAGSWYFC